MSRGTYIRTEEHRLKMSKAKKGKKIRKQSPEHIRKKIEAWKKSGAKPPSQKGKKRTLETRQKMSEALKGKNGSNWQGGKSFEPYSLDWTKTLRIAIRERDHYTCQICKEKQGDKTFSVHHIDYNKKNCNPDNLITLCIKCHLKTNFNRDYWIKYFNLLT